MAPPATPQEPGCCPDVYLCQGETECPRHSGFTVCCDQPELHIQVYTREKWHRLMWDYEQDLLNEHMEQHLREEKMIRRMVEGIVRPAIGSSFTPMIFTIS